MCFSGGRLQNGYVLWRDPLSTPVLSEVLSSLVPLRCKGSESVSQTEYTRLAASLRGKRELWQYIQQKKLWK